MPTITIPKKLIRDDDLVVLPRKEYEDLRERAVPVYKPSKRELRELERARKDYKAGKYIEWEKLKHELAHSRRK